MNVTTIKTIANIIDFNVFDKPMETPAMINAINVDIPAVNTPSKFKMNVTMMAPELDL